jgi:hypothetical protein
MNSIWCPRRFLPDPVEGNQKGEKSVGAVDSRGRTTRRRFDRGPNTGVGPVLRQHGREREKGWVRDRAGFRPKLIRENRNLFFYFQILI